MRDATAFKTTRRYSCCAVGWFIRRVGRDISPASGREQKEADAAGMSSRPSRVLYMSFNGFAVIQDASL